MGSVVEELLDAWGYLSEESVTEEGFPSRPLGISTEAGTLLVGLEQAHHLLIPVSRKGDVVVDRRSRGVVVVPQKGTWGGVEQWYADLVCVEGRLFDVYVRLAAAVCDAIEADPSAAGGVPAEILEEWRELLSRRTGGMGRDVATGLFGELAVLLQGVETAGPALFEHWLGPDGHQHDFAAADVCIEVKATTSREGRRIQVHGLEQLDVRGSSRLYLAFVRLLSDPGGRTISDLQRALCERGVPDLALLKRMTRVGYSEEEDADHRYTIKELDLYEVDADFPRVVDASFRNGVAPVGIEAVDYTVDLSAAGEPIDGERQSALFEQMVNG